MKQLILGVCLLVLLGCTDVGQRTNFYSLGSSYRVTLYSGGRVVERWVSTGKVLTDQDGYIFREIKTNMYIRVSGSVVVEQIIN